MNCGKLRPLCGESLVGWVYHYPEPLISAATAATEAAVDLLRRGVEPFGNAAGRWLEMIGQKP